MGTTDIVLVMLILESSISNQVKSQERNIACNSTQTPENCHCLNDSACVPSGPAGEYLCNDYQCDRGWREPPCCQQVCNDQTYGVNCVNLCHCRPNDSCNAINGYCSSGLCDPDWGGTACQIRLPKLTSPPQVENGTCNLLYVTWRPWNKDMDIGDAVTVDSYTVEQRVNYTATNFTAQWTNVQRVQSGNDSRQYMIQVFVSDSYNYMEFRVITNWLDLGKPFPGRPSEPSLVVRPITFCVVTRTTITTQSSAPSSTIYLSSTISSPSPTTSGAVSSSTPITTTIIMPTTTTPPPPIPSAPRNVQIPFTTGTMIQVTWSPPFPPIGNVLQYRVIYWRVGQEGSVVQTAVGASQRAYNITGLSPYTVYCVQIQAQTTVAANEGWGNRSDPVCSQTQEGLPSAPNNLQSTYQNESCISVQWTAPAITNGLLVSYRVTYRNKSVPNSDEVEIITSTSQLGCWICSGLVPDVQYNIQVQARTTSGLGSAASIDVWTEISRPDPPPMPQVISVENKTASVRIEPAVPRNGPVAAYFIVVSPLQSSPVQGRGRRALSDDPVTVIPLPGYTAAQLSTDDVRQARSFVIGDNNSYGSYINRPLEIYQWYSVYYVVASSRDGVVVKMNYAQTPTAFQTGTQLVVTFPTTQFPVTGAILAVGGLTSGEKAAIGILVPLAILLLILGLLLLYFCWWRKRKEEKERDASNRTWLQFYQSNFSDMPKKKKWNDIYSLEEPRHIVTNDVVVGGPNDIHVDDLPHRRKTISFEDEYRQLQVGQVFLCTEAQKPENADKNRFDHLLAYDHTRVHLENSSDGSDYYNANYIPGYDRRRKAYIAAQSPFNERTICDFWLLVYEQKVSKIVFLAQLLEQSIVKSEKYWSDDHLTHHYGSIAVTLTRTHSYANWAIRTFSINRIGQYGVRTVTQYQFTAWPEHGVPEDPFAILEFRRKVGSSAEAPLLVHCGTGVSRSAVYVVIDFCLAKAEAENNVNVYRCCSTMRQCRTMMVRTLKQYIFIYEALFEALIASHLIVRQDVKSVYDFLKKTNPKTKTTYFKEQLQLLEKYLDDPTDDQCKSALSPENRTKNRFSTLRLIVRDRDLIPMRSPDRPTRLAYINALALNSYTRRNAFIVTQSPLAATVADFWNLVYDQKVCCIVALNGHSFREDTCIQYWPSVQRVVQKVNGGFRLTLLAEEHKEHVIVRTLQLTKDDTSTMEDWEMQGSQGSRGKGKARTITQYQFQSWNMYDQIPWSNGGFLELIDSVSKERKAELYNVPSDAAAAAAAAAAADGHAAAGAGFGRLPPIVVHCIDGASQSGLFCACYVICQKMNLDKEVDVFHSIKEMKQKRFHFVNSLDQYKFCFKLLWDFVNFRMTPSTG